jgi:hypothetical protein
MIDDHRITDPTDNSPDHRSNDVEFVCIPFSRDGDVIVSGWPEVLQLPGDEAQWGSDHHLVNAWVP